MDLFDALKKVIDDLKAEYALARADGNVDMKELGQMVIHTAYAVATIIAGGAVESEAVKVAAEKLYDELLAPILLRQIDSAVGNIKGFKGFFIRIAKTIGVPLIKGALRAKWISFVAGLIEGALPDAQDNLAQGALSKAEAVHQLGAIRSRSEFRSRRERRRANRGTRPTGTAG